MASQVQEMLMLTVSDLDAAMMQPARSVPAVRRLGGGSIRMNDAGRPLSTVGHDAIVYELRTPTGRILALRCLLRLDPRRDSLLAARYEALGRNLHLEQLRGTSGALPNDIRWIADAIALPGPDLRQMLAPMIVMERIPGRTLLQTVDRLCREKQSEPLGLLADSWLKTVSALEDVAFVHGDLTADNLIVRPDGSIALVDLDSASWPSLNVSTSMSVGTPAYTHPHGAPKDPTRHDRFPALVIWASLRILAHHPDLRERWGDQPDQYGGALLWSVEDLRRPASAPLFKVLEKRQASDELLVPVLEVMRRAIRFPPDETPPLTEVAERLEVLGFPRWTASRSSSARRVKKPVEIPPRARDTVPEADNTDGEWHNGAFSDNRRIEGDVRYRDATQTTALIERENRRALARELGAAIAARDINKALGLWETSRTVPETATYAAAVHLLISRETSAAIERALRRKDDDGLIAAVAEAERAGVAPSEEARTAVRLARQRIAARIALREAMNRGDYHALAGLSCSGALDCLGRLEATYSRAIQRALAWATLERALVGDDDVAIAAAADPVLWREEGSLPPAARARIDLARSRIQWAEEVRAALRRRDAVVLRGLLTSAPPEAETLLTHVESRRILRMSTREAAVHRLEQALREGPDREVVAALSELESAGAPFPDVLDWTAVRGVVDRISLADALRTAATADPPDTAQLARLLPAARAALVVQGTPGEPDWAALEHAVLRAAHLARLREAIAADNDARISFAAVPDPYGARSLLTSEENERVQQALTRSPNSAA